MKKKELKQEIVRLNARIAELEAENARLRFMQPYQPFQPLPSPLLNPPWKITVDSSSVTTTPSLLYKIWYTDEIPA